MGHVAGSWSRAVQAFESVSTWRQPMPPPAAAERTAVIATVAGRIAESGPGRLRVAVDGCNFAHPASTGPAAGH